MIFRHLGRHTKALPHFADRLAYYTPLTTSLSIAINATCEDIHTRQQKPLSLSASLSQRQTTQLYQNLIKIQRIKSESQTRTQTRPSSRPQKCNIPKIEKTNVSMDAFARLEMKLTKKRIAASTAAAAAEQSQIPLQPQSQSPNVSIDAFTRLEMKLAKKRTVANDSNATMAAVSVDIGDESLVEPSEPDPNECCGLDCPNCVWIQYSNEMIAYQSKLASLKP